jgi:hypothetical protein
MEAAPAERPAAKAEVAPLQKQLKALEKEVATAQTVAAGIEGDIHYGRQRKRQLELGSFSPRLRPNTDLRSTFFAMYRPTRHAGDALHADAEVGRNAHV